MHLIGLNCLFKKAAYSKVNIQKRNSKKKKVKLKKAEFYIINKIIIKINKKTQEKNMEYKPEKNERK